MGKQNTIAQTYIGSKKQSSVSWYFSNGSSPVAVVDDTVFERMKQDLDPALRKQASTYRGIDIMNEEELQAANLIFKELGFDRKDQYDSRLERSYNQKNRMGLTMFIRRLPGLTFLITSGCILYFKQMDESADEKPTYTILRKLGYSQNDLMRGIRRKQLFNFGIPLVVGLLHSYFAVLSGWFLFGAELWTPMMLVMGLYTVLYSVFGFLSVQHYKKTISRSL